jgi:hypothetical protein
MHVNDGEASRTAAGDYEYFPPHPSHHKRTGRWLRLRSMPVSSEVLHRLTDLVDMERQCCAFLTFKIVIANDAMKLEVTGPREAKKLIAEYFTL